MPIGRQADHGKRALGGFIGLGAAMTALAVIAGERHVLKNAEPVKRPRDLEGAADAAVDDAVRGDAAISAPSNRIDPAVGTSVPDSMLKIVLLPEPFGPIRPRISPCSTRNDTLLTAVKPPKRFTNPSTVSTPDAPLQSCYRSTGC